HDVDADNVAVDAAGRIDADHFRQEGLVLIDEFLRDHAGAQDLATVIDVIEKGVEGTGPLADAARQLAPFGGPEHARDEIERDKAFGIAPLAIDGEGDADLAEDRLGLALPQLETIDPGGVDPFGHLFVG